MNILLKNLEVTNDNKDDIEMIYSNKFIKEHYIMSRISNSYIYDEFGDIISRRNASLRSIYIAHYNEKKNEIIIELDMSSKEEIIRNGKRVIVNNPRYITEDIMICAEYLSDIRFIERIEELTDNRLKQKIRPKIQCGLGGCGNLKNQIQHYGNEKKLQYFIFDGDVKYDKSFNKQIEDNVDLRHRIYILDCYSLENAIPLEFFEQFPKRLQSKTKLELLKSAKKIKEENFEEYKKLNITGLIKLTKLKDEESLKLLKKEHFCNDVAELTYELRTEIVELTNYYKGTLYFE